MNEGFQESLWPFYKDCSMSRGSRVSLGDAIKMPV